MLLKWYKYISILSLDVAVGACVSTLFLSRWLQVDLSFYTILLLGLTVWLIYTFDHLMDARKIKHQASTSRHRFHQEHFHSLSWACLFTLFVICALIFIVPAVTVVWGIALACLVGAYFLLLHLLDIKSVYHKEIMIAVIYAAGVMVGPLSIFEGPLTPRMIIVFVQFSALALTNIILFALLELQADENDNSPSVVRLLGGEKIARVLKVFVIFQVICAVILYLATDYVILEATFLVMVILLGILLFLMKKFQNKDLYRYLGDAVFMLPYLALIFF